MLFLYSQFSSRAPHALLSFVRSGQLVPDQLRCPSEHFGLTLSSLQHQRQKDQQLVTAMSSESALPISVSRLILQVECRSSLAWLPPSMSTSPPVPLPLRFCALHSDLLIKLSRFRPVAITFHNYPGIPHYRIQFWIGRSLTSNLCCISDELFLQCQERSRQKLQILPKISDRTVLLFLLRFLRHCSLSLGMLAGSSTFTFLGPIVASSWSRTFRLAYCPRAQLSPQWFVHLSPLAAPCDTIKIEPQLAIKR